MCEVCEGGGFSERSSATSIGAAYGRLFRLRKTAMLSRHWRLWLSFPSLALPPEERLALELVISAGLVPPERGGDSLAIWLWSRRLTEPPRPANGGYDTSSKVSGPKGWRGRSESHRLASADATSKRLPPQRELSAARLTEDTSLPPQSCIAPAGRRTSSLTSSSPAHTAPALRPSSA